MTKTEIILTAIGVLLFFRSIRELAYIRLYSMVIRLQAEGKLIPENDPKGIAKKMEDTLKKNSSKWL